MLHKDYLEKNNRVFINVLLTQDKLYKHCAKVKNQALDMFYMLVEQVKETESIAEQLKENNQIAWVQIMGNIETIARAIVCSELIYV